MRRYLKTNYLNNVIIIIKLKSLLTRFSIEIKFLYHEMTFLICENKKIKENRKTSHVIKCVMIFIFFILKKLRYIKYQAI